MAEMRRGGRDTGDKEGRGMRPRRSRRKVCAFCADKIEHIEYKDTGRLRKFVSERGKILPKRMSGNCAKHQRELTIAIKRSRHIALLPFAGE
jgi:small subunit ribosomal protein S18